MGLLKFGAGFFGEGDSNKEGSGLSHTLLLGVSEAVGGACEVKVADVRAETDDAATLSSRPTDVGCSVAGGGVFAGCVGLAATGAIVNDGSGGPPSGCMGGIAGTSVVAAATGG